MQKWSHSVFFRQAQVCFEKTEWLYSAAFLPRKNKKRQDYFPPLLKILFFAQYVLSHYKGNILCTAFAAWVHLGTLAAAARPCHSLDVSKCFRTLLHCCDDFAFCHIVAVANQFVILHSRHPFLKFFPVFEHSQSEFFRIVRVNPNVRFKTSEFFKMTFRENICVYAVINSD